MPEQNSSSVTSLPGDQYNQSIELPRSTLSDYVFDDIISNENWSKVVVREDEQTGNLFIGVYGKKESDKQQQNVEIHELPILIRYMSGRVRIELDTVRITNMGKDQQTLWNSSIVIDLGVGDDKHGSIVLNNSYDNSDEKVLAEVRKRFELLQEILIRFGNDIISSPELRERMMRKFKF